MAKYFVNGEWVKGSVAIAELATLRAENEALKAENARYRDIVQTLAGWHDEASQIDTSPCRFPIVKLLEDKRHLLDELCSDAWEALDGGGDGA